MPSDRGLYEIHTFRAKGWRLRARLEDSQQAIEQATKLQHSQEYAAIRVVVRPSHESSKKGPPRLLYQFTRPAAARPASPVQETSPSDQSRRRSSRKRRRRRSLPRAYWFAAGTVALLLVLAFAE